MVEGAVGARGEDLVARAERVHARGEGRGLGGRQLGEVRRDRGDVEALERVRLALARGLQRRGGEGLVESCHLS